MHNNGILAQDLGMPDYCFRKEFLGVTEYTVNCSSRENCHLATEAQSDNP